MNNINNINLSLSADCSKIELTKTESVPNGPIWKKFSELTSINICCKQIILSQQSMGIDIDITNILDNLDEIIVNGIKFKRDFNGDISYE